MTRSVWQRPGVLSRTALGAALVTASIIGTSTSAGAHEWRQHRTLAFTRTIEPFFPGQTPATPPTVLPTVACVRSVGGLQLEAVFGFVNTGTLSAAASVPDGENRIVLERLKRAPVEADGPQVTQFLPGAHPHAFAVRFRIGEVPVWKVKVPASDDEFSPAWLASVRPTFLTWCGRDVPRRFSVVQAVPDEFTAADITYDDLGNVASYRYEARFDGAVTACSAGGTPLPVEAVVGWNQGVENLAPLAEAEIIATDVRGGTEYQLTLTRSRQVIDVRQVTSVSLPSSDITGRCSFPDGTIVESTPYWADFAAVHQIEPIEVDGVLTLQLSAVLPGGIKFR